MNARLRFLGDTADLLTVPNDSGVVEYPVTRRTSIKDVIEALGVPHTEVYGISVCGVEGDSKVGFEYMLEGGDEVVLSQAEPPIDVTVPTLLRPEPLSHPRFLVDVNVGRTAVLLRLLGYDTAYDRHWDDRTIAEKAAEEGRIVLSRDRALLKRKCIVHGRLIRSVMPADQAAEVVRLYGLPLGTDGFRRCLVCNGDLDSVDKEAIMDRLLPKTRKYYDDFRMCRGCGKIYWAGSHHAKMVRFIEEMKNRAGE